MKNVPISRGFFAIVDDNDFDVVGRMKWYAVPTRNGRTCYAQHQVNGKSLSMHREIMKPPKGWQVDHINGNGLDNRRENLRFVSNADNQKNRVKVSTRGTSKYKGVSWNSPKKRWHARIKLNGRDKFLGAFRDEVKAAEAYNRAAASIFGEFARLNEIPDGREEWRSDAPESEGSQSLPPSTPIQGAKP